MLFLHLISRNEPVTGLFVQWVTSLIESKTQNFQSYFSYLVLAGESREI